MLITLDARNGIPIVLPTFVRIFSLAGDHITPTDLLRPPAGSLPLFEWTVVRRRPNHLPGVFQLVSHSRRPLRYNMSCAERYQAILFSHLRFGFTYHQCNITNCEISSLYQQMRLSKPNVPFHRDCAS